jgi:pyruvate dehydrogenase E2 component (dihydrolipoamide acetyltransferase)
MAEIVMPRLSDTMEEGTVLRWLKRDGERVRRGEELVEIETDKATMAYESDQDGVLEIVAREGDTLAVGAVIAHVGEAAGAEDIQAGESQPGPEQPALAPSTAPDTALPAAAGGSPPAHSPAELSTPGTPAPTAGSADAPEHADAPDGARVKASPLARRIAREGGVDLHAVTGSGPGGRIVKADVEAAERSPQASSSVTTVPAPPPTAPATPSEAPTTLAERVATAKGETTVVELTRTQRTIARRMAESKATIPDFALQIEIDMEECVALRSELKRLSPHEAPTYNDMVVKACALALREHPRANGSYRDGHLELHGRVNVGVAVAVAADPRRPGVPVGPPGSVDAPGSVDEPGPADAGDAPGSAGVGDALVVPTVFDADLKSLGEIARETRALAERVRAGTIAPPELGGGTFTVSNLGMHGVRSFTAIVNPPQAAILSVGALEPRAVVWAGGRVVGAGPPRGQGVVGEIVARHTLAATLACDHRVLYGADAARFLARIRELLEEPAALTL